MPLLSSVSALAQVICALSISLHTHATADAKKAHAHPQQSIYLVPVSQMGHLSFNISGLFSMFLCQEYSL